MQNSWSKSVDFEGRSGYVIVSPLDVDGVCPLISHPVVHGVNIPSHVFEVQVTRASGSVHRREQTRGSCTRDRRVKQESVAGQSLLTGVTAVDGEAV